MTTRVSDLIIKASLESTLQSRSTRLNYALRDHEAVELSQRNVHPEVAFLFQIIKVLQMEVQSP